jgi:hypothetical protein
MNCDTCELTLEPNNSISRLDSSLNTTEIEKHYTLSINSETLARLIQRQQLTIADLHCMNGDTKQFIQSVLLQCILCKTLQSQPKI